ncbi:uncharacterized protein P884DRAFT_258757 [Thermothelomyces heterothallicus CBS 202.75]|uniref:uncharacterized protein n=1 Tax=Thermothelomyces heterothallicus CBS 202.75 TaxID=1149848 RepID=UPI00374439F1
MRPRPKQKVRGAQATSEEKIEPSDGPRYPPASSVSCRTNTTTHSMMRRQRARKPQSVCTAGTKYMHSCLLSHEFKSYEI